MKRIPQRLSYALGPVRLYLDDVDDIAAQLRSGAGSVEMQACEFEIESTDKLSDLKMEVIHDLTIESQNPHIAVRLWPRNAEIIAYRDDPASRGLFEVIKDNLHRHQRSFGGFHRYPMIGGVIIGLAPWAFFFVPMNLWARVLLSVAVLLVGLALSLPILQIFRGSYSTIVLSSRATRTTFWRRKGDEILIALISAIVGSLITLAISKLLG